MADVAAGLLRPRYFERQSLQAADLTLGIDYGRERLRRHNRYLHGWGAVCGAIVNRDNDPWQVVVSEGYVVTPQGDEVYIPAGAAPYHLQQEATACLGLDPACPEPDDLDDERSVKILRGNLDPLGKDVHGDYNREWLQIKVLRETTLDGYVVQHTINPQTASAAFAEYYTFHENRLLAAGTIIRIHSGAQADDPEPASGMEHRYVADPGERGNWRLNNPFDTVRILDAAGAVVDQRDLTRQFVYLAVYADETNVCPQPVVPAACQPPGGRYEAGRTREGHRFALLCELPPSHQQALSCATLESIICRNAVAPCPPALGAADNGVVLAALAVSDEGIIDADNVSVRRQLLSESLIQAYLRCRCEGAAAPHAAFDAAPRKGVAPLTVKFVDQSTGEIGGWLWHFGDGEASTLQNPAHSYALPGAYTVTLTVTGPGGTDTETAASLVTVTPAPPIAAFAAAPMIGFVPLSVQFTDQSSGEISSRFWQFGDGAGSTVVSPQHVYTTQGVFVARLQISGSGGSATATQVIRALNIPILEQPNLHQEDFDFELGRTLPLNQVPGIGAVRMQRLRAAGINTVLDALSAPQEQLATILAVTPEVAQQLQAKALLQLRRTP